MLRITSGSENPRMHRVADGAPVTGVGYIFVSDQPSV